MENILFHHIITWFLLSGGWNIHVPNWWSACYRCHKGWKHCTFDQPFMWSTILPYLFPCSLDGFVPLGSTFVSTLDGKHPHWKVIYYVGSNIYLISLKLSCCVFRESKSKKFIHWCWSSFSTLSILVSWECHSGLIYKSLPDMSIITLSIPLLYVSLFFKSVRKECHLSIYSDDLTLNIPFYCWWND